MELYSDSDNFVAKKNLNVIVFGETQLVLDTEGMHCIRRLLARAAGSTASRCHLLAGYVITTFGSRVSVEQAHFPRGAGSGGLHQGHR